MLVDAQTSSMNTSLSGSGSSWPSNHALRRPPDGARNANPKVRRRAPSRHPALDRVHDALAKINRQRFSHVRQSPSPANILSRPRSPKASRQHGVRFRETAHQHGSAVVGASPTTAAEVRILPLAASAPSSHQVGASPVVRPARRSRGRGPVSSLAERRRGRRDRWLASPLPMTVLVRSWRGIVWRCEFGAGSLRVYIGTGSERRLAR